MRFKTRVFINPTIQGGQVHSAGKLEYFDLDTESWSPFPGGNVQIYIKRVPNGFVKVQAFFKGDVLYASCKSQVYTLRVGTSQPVRRSPRTI